MDKLHDVELSPRGLPRNLGLKLGKTTPKTYEARITLLMTTPGVGAYFGLPQRRYQPDETDIAGRISKLGDDFEKRMPTSNCVAMIAQTPPVP